MRRAVLVGIWAVVFTVSGLVEVAAAQLTSREQHWSHRRDWWRGRPEWRDYAGPRRGWAYAPGYGYYRMDPKYYENGGWRRGQYVPAELRAHYVRDPAFFRVRQAPRGYAWIWCGPDILLVSMDTGLILDVVHDVY
jgi:Ni/Co efflux regulator RcnB